MAGSGVAFHFICWVLASLYLLLAMLAAVQLVTARLDYSFDSTDTEFSCYRCVWCCFGPVSTLHVCCVLAQLSCLLVQLSILQPLTLDQLWP